jgi:hypothetical protein
MIPSYGPMGPIFNNWPTLSRALPDARLRVVSFGAGVQSTTMLLMAARGLIRPMPDIAIFADTGDEMEYVHEHVRWMRSPNVALPFPIVTVSNGNIRQELLDAAQGIQGAWGRPPLFIKSGSQRGGQTRRQCTGDYKIDPIMREVRRLAGIKPRSPGPKTPVVEQWIGISTDEIGRLSPAKFRWIQNRHPLVELDMSRRACEQWLLREFGLKVKKSACRICPYRSDMEWRRLRDEEPEEFEKACEVDDAIRTGKHIMLKGQPYIHRSLEPLREVAFKDKTPEPVAWLGECTGLCGL